MSELRTGSDGWLEAHDLLVHEAALLDGRELEAWLELFAPHATYWLPIVPDDPDPDRDVSLIYDDRARLRERVIRAATGHAYAQDPPSRTLHLITNVRVSGSGAGYEVRSNQLITEVRKHRQTIYAATVEHQLERAGDALAIAAKTVRLINSDAPLANLTFLL